MGFRTDSYDKSLAQLDHIRFGLRPAERADEMREVQGEGVFWILRTLFQDKSTP